MRLLHFLIVIKYSVSFFFKETQFPSNRHVKLVYSEKSPSRLACVQKALHFKGDAVYEEGRCSVVMKKDGKDDGESVALERRGHYLRKMRDVDRMDDLHKISNVNEIVPVEEKKHIWKTLQKIIKTKIRPSRENLKGEVASLPDEFRLLLSIWLNSYNDYENFPAFFQISSFDKNKKTVSSLKIVLGNNKGIRVTLLFPNENFVFSTDVDLPLKEWHTVKMAQVRKGTQYKMNFYLNTNLVRSYLIDQRFSCEDECHVTAAQEIAFADGFVRNFILYKKEY